MRILAADNLPALFESTAAQRGWHVTIQSGLTAHDLPEVIAGYDVLVVRSTKVSTATIEAGDSLALIVRAGAGTNTIDVEAASRRAIAVSNVPGRNAIAVAELTMALLFAIDRRVPDNVSALRDNVWDKKRFSRARGLYGRVFGIVGLGSIGREVATRAAAMGMSLVAMRRPNAAPESLELIDRLRIELVDTPTELAGRADVVSFHVPLNGSTRGMVDAGFLAAMRPGAVLLNTSRGEIVADEATLIEAIESKDLRVGLDVFHDEPPAGEGVFASALASHPNVYGTHHIGASTDQAQEAVAEGVLEVLAAHGAGRFLNAVNVIDATGEARIAVRHVNRVGVLSAVLQELRRAGINVENMENRIFNGGAGAVAHVSLSAVPAAETQAAIQELPEVIGLSVMSGQ